MTKPTKVKKITAWAVIDLRKGNTELFTDPVGEIGYHEPIVNIFLDEKEARKYHKWTNLEKEMKLVKCEISYPQTKVKRK